eukprot:TRINITY_DN48520_c0_g1_i1.p1 TRINITY_DN48520_c0_g1~~TRINITY_DN48520_c0_g1_i1.p1  ORF type:complete len:131 (+),score=33.78 TRINITY_DN48520_c0_g1_i1:140-532(+)
MIRRPPRSTLSSSSAASDVYKRQVGELEEVRRAGHIQRGIVEEVADEPTRQRRLAGSKLPNQENYVTFLTLGHQLGAQGLGGGQVREDHAPVSYTHLRAHETPEHLVCRLLLEKKKKIPYQMTTHTKWTL